MTEGLNKAVVVEVPSNVVASGYLTLITKTLGAVTLAAHAAGAGLQKQLDKDKDAKRRFTQVAYVVCAMTLGVVAVFSGNVEFGYLIVTVFALNLLVCHLSSSKPEDGQERR